VLSNEDCNTKSDNYGKKGKEIFLHKKSVQGNGEKESLEGEVPGSPWGKGGSQIEKLGEKIKKGLNRGGIEGV